MPTKLTRPGLRKAAYATFGLLLAIVLTVGLIWQVRLARYRAFLTNNGGERVLAQLPSIEDWSCIEEGESFITVGSVLRVPLIKWDKVHREFGATEAQSDPLNLTVAEAVEASQDPGGIGYDFIAFGMGTEFQAVADGRLMDLRNRWFEWQREITQTRPLSAWQVLTIGRANLRDHMFRLKLKNVTLSDGVPVLARAPGVVAVVSLASGRRPGSAYADVCSLDGKWRQRIAIQDSSGERRCNDRMKQVVSCMRFAN